MSGKAPPRAPRALRHSLAVASSSSQPPTAPSSSRLGATPPTGPRSLASQRSSVNGVSLPPKGLSTKVFTNGHAPYPPTAASSAPPTGPSARFSHLNKGKHIDNGNAHGPWQASSAGPSAGGGSSTGSSASGVMVVSLGFTRRVSSSPSRMQLPPSQAPLATQASGAGPAVRTSPAPVAGPSVSPPPLAAPAPAVSMSVGLNLHAPAISFRLRPPPPQPTTEPPPPPPPSSTPPPPPPPSAAPPPAPPPPSSSPPPPPPPSSEPPPPPPPPGAMSSKLSVERVAAPSPALVPSIQPINFSRAPPSGPRSTRLSLDHAPKRPSPPRELSPPPPPPPEPRPPSPKLYSLPEPPPWPSRAEYTSERDFRIIFDPLVDKDRDGRMRTLIETVREFAPERIHGKAKGKEILIRYNGEVVEGETAAVPSDPRKDSKVKRLQQLSRIPRDELYGTQFAYDQDSAGPPPATAVLILNISPLVTTSNIRRYFSTYGDILSFEPQMNKATGMALGIVFIKFPSAKEAQRCVDKENGKQGSTGIGNEITIVEGEELKVVLDGEGKKLNAVLREMEARNRRKEREERKRKEEQKLRELGVAGAKGTPTSTSASHTPMPGQPWRSTPQSVPGQKPMLSGRDQYSSGGSPAVNGKPMLSFSGREQYASSSGASPAVNGKPNGFIPTRPPTEPARARRPPDSLTRARNSTWKAMLPSGPRPSRAYGTPYSHSSSSTPAHTARRGYRGRGDYGDSPLPSRSPSPISRRPGASSRAAKTKEHEAIMQELAKNGFDYVTLDSHGNRLSSVVREEDVRKFFTGFEVDKVFQDSIGWYVSFKTGDTARRAAMVLNGGARTLAQHSVNIAVHFAPNVPAAPVKTRWDDAELIQQAEKIILQDLKAMLEKDITERVVGPEFRRLISDEKRRRAEQEHGADGAQAGVHFENEVVERPALHATSLKGLSFRKQKKRLREEPRAVSVEVKEATPSPETPAPETPALSVKELELQLEPEAEPTSEGEPEVEERPRKRLKKAPKVLDEDIESEDELPAPLPLPVVTITDDVTNRKRVLSVTIPLEEPPIKKVKVVPEPVLEEDDFVVPVKKKTKKASKKKARIESSATLDELIHEVLPDEEVFEAPAVTHVHVTPVYESSTSPPPPPSPVRSKKPVRRSPTPTPVDLAQEGICQDDEDVYFARLALSGEPKEHRPPSPVKDVELHAEPQSPLSPKPARVHATGSARTEGYYKITHAEKSAYVAQYASRGLTNTTEVEEEAPQTQNVTSSRSNRANARRRAQGLEEINQVQRAMALSKGESAAAELVKFNQLQTRKKHMRFARSPIHDWGLYAMEKISRGEMVIEYVGEIIRAQVADKREKAYERQGIGSSYLFRIDEDLVVDATKKGNLGRLINHSCDPNCTAKIITINGEKKIVIYAKQDIELGSEITYDYHFPIEQDKIPCLCGSAKCRGYLN